MANIVTDPNGHRRIQFVAADRTRKTVRLGKCSQRDAEQVCRHVEALAASTVHGQPVSRDTAVWLSAIGDPLHDRLARAGLVQSRELPPAVKLESFLRAYLDGRADLKPATRLVRNQVVQDLANKFGANCDMRSITPGMADDFKQWLIARGLASTTIHKRLQVAKSFFHAMHRRKLITENPFDGVRMSATGVAARQRFVTLDETASLLAACPDHHWRAIVALSRFGGLRSPSEVLSLRWSDIDWDTGRMVVRSPKTEHHADKASRVVPLFPELRRVLMECFELAEPGAVYVVDERYRRAAQGPAGWRNANLRTTFGKIVRRAGLSPWPRLFHNLRASRETELVERFPVQVVTSWLGNTPSVAMRHYLMTTEAHFEDAVRSEEPAEKAVQKAAQSAHAPARTASQQPEPKTKNPANCGVFQDIANGCEPLQEAGIAGAGFEPATSGL